MLALTGGEARHITRWDHAVGWSHNPPIPSGLAGDTVHHQELSETLGNQTPLPASIRGLPLAVTGRASHVSFLGPWQPQSVLGRDVGPVASSVAEKPPFTRTDHGCRRFDAFCCKDIAKRLLFNLNTWQNKGTLLQMSPLRQKETCRLAFPPDAHPATPQTFLIHETIFSSLPAKYSSGT